MNSFTDKEVLDHIKKFRHGNYQIIPHGENSLEKKKNFYLYIKDSPEYVENKIQRKQRQIQKQFNVSEVSVSHKFEHFYYFQLSQNLSLKEIHQLIQFLDEKYQNPENYKVLLQKKGTRNLQIPQKLPFVSQEEIKRLKSLVPILQQSIKKPKIEHEINYLPLYARNLFQSQQLKQQSQNKEVLSDSTPIQTNNIPEQQVQQQILQQQQIKENQNNEVLPYSTPVQTTNIPQQQVLQQQLLQQQQFQQYQQPQQQSFQNLQYLQQQQQQCPLQQSYPQFNPNFSPIQQQPILQKSQQHGYFSPMRTLLEEESDDALNFEEKKKRLLESYQEDLKKLEQEREQQQIKKKENEKDRKNKKITQKEFDKILKYMQEIRKQIPSDEEEEEELKVKEEPPSNQKNTTQNKQTFKQWIQIVDSDASSENLPSQSTKVKKKDIQDSKIEDSFLVDISQFDSFISPVYN